MNRDQIMAALSSDEDVSDNSFVDDPDADPDFNLNLSDDSDLEYVDVSDSSDDDTSIIPIIQTPTQTEPNWGPVSENVSCPVFNEQNETFGINPDLFDTLIDGTSFDFFSLFVDNEILSILVNETNRYGNNLCSLPLRPKSRLKKWTEVNIDEMKTFLGIVMWMGFEIILRTFHCSNNAECPPGDRLFKIRNLVDLLVMKFKMWNVPSKNMCIDESVIPFVGRLSFRQFIKNKRHRYGIKVFKLCINDGYTIGFKIYAGQESVPGVGVSTKIVMELAEDYLDKGRTMYTDNWYTKFNPVSVVKAKLKKGEIMSSQSQNNIVVLKWKDKRDVLMLSTKHKNNTVVVNNKRGKQVVKPQMVIDYNKAKGYVDICDLRSSYHSPLRRSLKWYRKVMFEILLNTCLLNAMSLYTAVTSKKISVTQFRESIIHCLIKKIEVQPSEEKHILINAQRGKCYICYKEMAEQGGRQHAQKITHKGVSGCSSTEPKIVGATMFMPSEWSGGRKLYILINIISGEKVDKMNSSAADTAKLCLFMDKCFESVNSSL
ncbi:piggyBac transposable element-derived protein 4-like [Metopolophium dirhodum]|uniref:piggyBac transposable element-derived protein 4-like n=1 Tax=Metopolophium dirhodum TaxID=44670 RepID=UPI00299080CF|nr:piggyBac transposable element-derived protein 4-like [Metopolophium dirhodum]